MYLLAKKKNIIKSMVIVEDEFESSLEINIGVRAFFHSLLWPNKEIIKERSV